ncbi:MAG: DUF2975 domain-containing protein [Beijerinckiaceae bacterium]
MTDALDMPDQTTRPEEQSKLRRKIGWLCHAIRILAVAWIAWVLVTIIQSWGDRAHVINLYGRFFHADLSDMSQSQYLGAFALLLLVWSIAATMVAALWRLFGTYLAGRIFTIESAVWLRRVGVLGALAVILDILARPALSMILTSHIETGHWGALFVMPQDVLNIIFAAFVFSLAYIFKAAAELADDHSQIV